MGMKNNPIEKLRSQINTQSSKNKSKLKVYTDLKNWEDSILIDISSVQEIKEFCNDINNNFFIGLETNFSSMPLFYSRVGFMNKIYCDLLRLAGFEEFCISVINEEPFNPFYVYNENFNCKFYEDFIDYIDSNEIDKVDFMEIFNRHMNNPEFLDTASDTYKYADIYTDYTGAHEIKDVYNAYRTFNVNPVMFCTDKNDVYRKIYLPKQIRRWCEFYCSVAEDLMYEILGLYANRFAYKSCYGLSDAIRLLEDSPFNVYSGFTNELFDNSSTDFPFEIFKPGYNYMRSRFANKDEIEFYKRDTSYITDINVRRYKIYEAVDSLRNNPSNRFGVSVVNDVYSEIYVFHKDCVFEKKLERKEGKLIKIKPPYMYGLFSYFKKYIEKDLSIYIGYMLQNLVIESKSFTSFGNEIQEEFVNRMSEAIYDKLGYSLGMNKFQSEAPKKIYVEWGYLKDLYYKSFIEDEDGEKSYDRKEVAKAYPIKRFFNELINEALDILESHF